jgi:hypothetical protein
MSRRLKTVVLVATLTAGSSSTFAQSSLLKTTMRDKLATTQALLEPVVRGDFAAITRLTEPLTRITETEIATWQATAEQDYVRQATLFLLSVEGLRDAARRNNIDAVTVEYSSLVSSCARCHAYVRTARRASLEGPPDSMVQTRRESW